MEISLQDTVLDTIFQVKLVIQQVGLNIWNTDSEQSMMMLPIVPALGGSLGGA